MGWGCGFNNWSILIPKLRYLLRFVTLERPMDKALLCWEEKIKGSRYENRLEYLTHSTLVVIQMDILGNIGDSRGGMLYVLK